eukprot:TRINITY_DN22190_c0_g1_i4.p1 TRINITY_DN22190_c0_g1~~TRINITY_DN22190_c0_g1_i4.p1  ORF type:complete len:399 (+),score=62.96 TRINITY_DN22190_c0_g1_i4:43-1239(+)
MLSIYLQSYKIFHYYCFYCCFFFFFQAEDGIRDAQESRGLGDVYKRQVLTSIAYAEQQRAAGMLQCAECGKFCSGHKGLRHHQQIVHQQTYERASQVADESQHQLMLYTARSTAAAPWKTVPKAQVQLDPVLEASKSGDLGQIEQLVADGHDLTRTDKHGSGPLLWAAGGGHLQVCRYLVEQHRVCPQSTQGDGRQPIHWAARNGHLEVCQWLVDECRVNPDAATVDGTTAFHWAVWQGHIDVCKWFVSIGSNWKSLNKYGCNAMQWAAQTSRMDMCRFLVDIGVDATLCNRNGHSSLHKAAVKGQRKVCVWLVHEVGLGAAQMKPDQDGNTPSVMARLEGYTELADWLQELEMQYDIDGSREARVLVGSCGEGSFRDLEQPMAYACHATKRTKTSGK